MLKVTTRPNKRLVDDFDTDFICRAGEIRDLPDRYLMANSIKALLWNGDLIIVEGEHTMNYKTSTVTIKAKKEGEPYVATFEENEKKMIKNLDSGEVEEVKEDDNE